MKQTIHIVLSVAAFIGLYVNRPEYTDFCYLCAWACAGIVLGRSFDELLAELFGKP